MKLFGEAGPVSFDHLHLELLPAILLQVHLLPLLLVGPPEVLGHVALVHSLLGVLCMFQELFMEASAALTNVGCVVPFTAA